MFGKLHPLIVHLPIGILLFNVVLVFLTRLEAYQAAKKILSWSLGLGALSAISACLTGWFLSQNGGYDDNTLMYHQYLGISVAVLATGLFIFKKQENRIGSIVLAVLLSVAGHFGGNLTHGENYLFTPENVAHTEGGKNGKPVIENIQKAVVFKDIIQPILNEKCVVCHGTTKQKGQLRFDEMASILRGGKNGAPLVAGQAEQSLMIKRLLLDIHEEEHMPPKGKPQPTNDEIELLKWWITGGTSSDKTVETMPQTDNIKAILASYSKGGGAAKPVSNDYLPKIIVDKADEKVLESLKKEGIMALPIAPNNNFLAVNFISKSNATDDDVKKLQPVLKHIAWLKLGNTAITDSVFSVISQMPNLTKLYLNDTRISDIKLADLINLEQLQYLNLVGTKVTAQGLTPLSKMKDLKQIFLFNTGISDKDSIELKTLFPNVQVDLGNYQVPTLVSDTSVLTSKKL